MVAAFRIGGRSRVEISPWNECFFRTAPLRSVRDGLCYPALLNCSKMHSEEGRPLAWICTENFDHSRIAEAEHPDDRMRAGMHELLRVLLDSGFNRSSEFHELTSWFTESTRLDDRISTIAKWEIATIEDPLFVLDIPWLDAERTLEQILERTFRGMMAPRARIRTAADIQRILFNHAD